MAEPSYVNLSDKEFEELKARHEFPAAAAEPAVPAGTHQVPRPDETVEIPQNILDMDDATFTSWLKKVGKEIRSEYDRQVKLGLKLMPGRGEIPIGPAPDYGPDPQRPSLAREAALFGRTIAGGAVRGAGEAAAFPVAVGEWEPTWPEALTWRPEGMPTHPFVGVERPPREGPKLAPKIRGGAERLAAAIEPEQIPRGYRPLWKTAEEAGAGVPMAGTVFATARRGARGIPFLRKWWESARREPVQFWGEEAASMAGAGYMRATVEEGEEGETLRGVAGAMAPSAARSVGHAANVARRMGRSIALGGPSPAVRDLRAAEIIQANVADRRRALDELREVERIREEIAINPSMFGGTADPGLKMLEMSLVLSPRKNDAVTAVALEEARRRGNAAVREAYIQAGPPRNAEATDLVASAARMNVERRIENIHDELLRSGAYVDEVSLARAQHGRILEDARAWRQEMRQGFGQLERDAARMNLLIPPSPLRRQATLARKGAGEYDVLPEDLLQDIDEMPKMVRYADMESFRRKVQRRITKELAQLGGVSESKAGGALTWLYMLRSGVEQSLDQMRIPTHGAVNKEQRKALEMIRRHNPRAGRQAIDEFSNRREQLMAAFRAGAERYRDGITGKIADRRLGRGVAPSETLGLYVKPNGQGAADAADEFLQKFPEEISRDAMSDYLVWKGYNATADVEGIPVSGRLARWTRRYSQVLDRFPAARARLENVHNITQSAEKMGIRSPRSREAVDQGALWLAVEDPRAAMERVLASPNPALAMRRLMGEVGTDPDAMRGLRRVFWDQMDRRVLQEDPLYFGRFRQLADASGENHRMVGGAHLRGFIDENEAAMRVLFGDQLPDQLGRLAAVSDIQMRTPVLTPSHLREEPVSPAQQLERGAIVALIASFERRVFRAFTRGEGVLDRIEGPYADELMREAMVDMQLLRHLLERNTKVNRRRLRRYMMTNLPTMPYRLKDDEADQATETRRTQ